jgi:hypothetical protein
MNSRRGLSRSGALRQLITAAQVTLDAGVNNEESEPSLDTEDTVYRYVAEQVSFPAAPHTQRYLRRHAEQLLQEAATLSAADVATAEAKEQEAARLFLVYQALTFQHQFLHQYSKRLGKLVLKKLSKRGSVALTHEESIEERLADKQRLRMIFRGEKEESVDRLVCGLPPTWTIVQISCVEQLTASRFKDTKKDEPSRTENPALCLIRVR